MHVDIVPVLQLVIIILDVKIKKAFFGGKKSEQVLNLTQNEKIYNAAQHKNNQKFLNMIFQPC